MTFEDWSKSNVFKQAHSHFCEALPNWKKKWTLKFRLYWMHLTLHRKRNVTHCNTIDISTNQYHCIQHIFFHQAIQMSSLPLLPAQLAYLSLSFIRLHSYTSAASWKTDKIAKWHCAKFCANSVKELEFGSFGGSDDSHLPVFIPVLFPFFIV